MKINVLSKSIIRVLSLVLILTLALFAVSCTDEPENPKGDRIISYVFFDYELEYLDNSCEPYIDYQTADSLGKEYIVLSLFEDNYFMLAIGGEVYSGSYDRSNEELHLDGISELDKNRLSFEEYSVKLDGSSLVFTARGRHLDKIIERATVKLTETPEIYNKDYFESLNNNPNTDVISVKPLNLRGEYMPGEFSPDIIKLEVYFADGTSRVIPLSDTGYDYYEATKPGTYVFHFDYLGYRGSFGYTILGNGQGNGNSLPEFTDKTVTYTGETFTHMPEEVAGLRYVCYEGGYSEVGHYRINVDVLSEHTGEYLGSVSAMLIIEPKVISLDEISDVEIEYTPDGLNADEYFNPHIFTLSIPDHKVGEYETTVWLNSNYVFDNGDTSATVKLTITPKAIDASGWRWMGERVITYSSDVWSELPKIDPSSVEGEIIHYISYRYFESEELGADGKPDGELAEGPMRVGVHNATAYVHDPNYVLEGLSSFEFELLPLKIEIPNIVAEFAYTGDYVGPAIAGIAPLNDGYAWYDGTAEACESGDYSFSLHLYDEGLVTWSDGSLQPLEYSWKISYRKATLGISTTAFDKGFTYTYDELVRPVSVTYEGTPYNVYLNDVCIAQDVYQNGSFFDLKLPGTYELRIETVGSETENVVWTQTVLINHVMITLTDSDIVWSELNPTYNGQYHSKTIVSCPSYVTPQYDVMGATDAGEHILSARFVIADEYYQTHRLANPEFVSRETLLIARKPISKPTVSQTEFTYRGSDIQLYRGSSYYTVDGGAAINVGNYVATFTPASNYCWDDGSELEYTVAWCINPVTVDIGELRFENGVYEYTPGGTTLSFYKNSTLDSYFDYVLNGQFATEPGDYTATFTATLKSRFIAGNYSFKNSAGEDVMLDGDGKFTVSKSWSIAPCLMRAPSAASVTYNGLMQKPTLSGYYSDIMSYDTEASYKNAGTYTVKVSIKNPKYYYFENAAGERVSSLDVEFVIEQAEAYFAVTLPFYSQDYDGKDYYVSATYGTGSEVLNAKITYLFGDNEVPVSSIKNAGRYTVVIDITDKDNYKLDAPKEQIIDVYRASVDINKLVWSAKEFTYNGLTQKPTIIGGISSDMSVPTYSYSGGSVDAGSYTVTATFAENDNYSAASVSIGYKINRKAVPLPEFTKTEFTYTGEWFKPEYTTEGYTVTESGEVRQSAGNYSFDYVIDANHIWLDAGGNAVTYHRVLWSIKKATHDLSGIKWSIDTDKVYPSDGTVYAPILTGLPDTLYARYSGQNSAIERGEYTVSATLYSYDSANYEPPVLDPSLLTLTYKIGYVESGLYTYYCTARGAILHSYSGNTESVTLPSEIGGKTVIGFDVTLLHSHSEIKVLDMGALTPGATSLKDLDSLTELSVASLTVPLAKVFGDNLLYSKIGNVPPTLDVLRITNASSMSNLFEGFVGSELHITASKTVSVSVSKININYLKFITLTQTSESSKLTFIHRYSSSSSYGGFAGCAIGVSGNVTVDMGVNSQKEITLIDTPLEKDGIYYSLNSETKTAALIYVTPRVELTVPSSVEHNGVSYTLTEIAEEALAANLKTLKDLTLPFLARHKGTPTTLSVFFGDGTPVLESLTVLSSPTLKEGSFDGLTYLSELTLPSDLTAIYNDFIKDTRVSTLTLPAGVTKIADEAFSSHKYLTSVEVLADKFDVGSYAFAYCKQLTEINLNGAYQIADYAFSGCEKLTGISIDSVASIGSYAFSNTAISWIVIPDTLTSLGTMPFAECRKLITVYWNVTSYTDSKYNPIFANAPVTTFVLGDNVEVLDAIFFNTDISLSGLEIPKSVQVFSRVFDNRSVHVDKMIWAPESYTATKLCTGSITADVLTLASGVKSVPTYFGVTAKKVIFPSTLEAINDNALLTATEIVFSSGLKTIGTQALTYNGHFLTLPNGLTSLGEAAITANNLAQLKIPASVTSLHKYAIYSNSGIAEVYNLSGIEASLPANTVHTEDTASLLRTDENGFVFYKHTYLDYDCLIAYVGEATDVTLPDGSYAVSGRAFSNTGVKSVTFPASTTIKLSSSMFANAPELEYVTFGEGYTALPSYAFYSAPKLRGVVLSDTMTEIGSDAFKDCVSLTQVNVPSAVTTIGSYAFDNCESLTQIILPQRLTKLGVYAFRDCKSLESISLGSALTKIGEYTFYKCEKLRSVSVPATVTEIGTGAFKYCSSLESVSLSSGLTLIDDYAFEKCVKLNTLTLPATLTEIGTSAFASTALRTLTVPASVEAVNPYCFDNCQSLTSVSFLGADTLVYTGVFRDCSSLTSVTLPSSLTYLNDYMFEGCRSLTSLTIPASVTTVGTGIGTRSSIERVYFEGTLAQYLSLDLKSYIFSNQDGVKLYVNGTQLTHLTVPASITEIKPYAFANLDTLVSVTLHDGVTAIGEHAFTSCSSLSSVTLSPSLKSIGTYAFYDVYAFESIVLPSGLEVIGEQAFTAYGTRVVIIPESVVEIGNMAFGNPYGANDTVTVYNYCALDVSALFSSKTVIITAIGDDDSAEFAVGDFIFNRIDGVYYLTAYTGSAMHLTLPENVNGESYVIGRRAFADNKTIATLIIPDGVVSVSDRAFSGVSSLYRLTIGKNVESIATSAFSGCNKLYEVYSLSYTGYIANCVRARHESLDAESIYTVTDDGFVFYKSGTSSYLVAYIGERTDITLPTSFEGSSYYISDGFRGRWDLTSVTIRGGFDFMPATAFADSASLVSIDVSGVSVLGGFNYCTSLKNVTIGAGVKEISTSAFRLSGIESIYIPKSVTRIDLSAFEDCKLLTSVSGMAGVTTIEANAFDGCIRLSSITLAEGLTEIKTYAFAYCTSLKSLNLPASLTVIEAGAFESCTSLNTHVASGGYYLPSYTNNYFALISIDKREDGIYRVHQSAELIGVDVIPADAEYVLCYGNIRGKLPSATTVIDASGTLFKEGDYTYVLKNDGTLAVIEYSGNALYVTVPTKAREWSVSEIAPYAFIGTTVRTVKLPEGIAKIGKYAFARCGALTSVDFPTTLTYIGDSAFYECQRLTDVRIKASLTLIGQNAFAHAISVGYVYIDGSVDVIGEGAFSGMSKLTELTVTGYVGTLSESAFAHCTRLLGVRLTGGVGHIEEYAFYETTGIDYIELCGEVGTVNFDYMPTSFDLYYNGTLAQWSSIQFIGSLGNVRNLYFDGKTAESIVIPDGITSLADYQFSHFENIKRITIPASVTSIGNGAFPGYTVEEIYFLGTLEEWMLLDFESLLFTADGGAKLYIQGVLLEDVTVPESISEIRDGCFLGISGIKSLTLHAGVTKIGSHAMCYCTSLTTLGGIESVTEIGEFAFYNTAITEFTVHEGVRKLGKAALSGCESLVRVTVLADLDAISDSCFNACTSLREVNIVGEIKEIGQYAFMGCQSLEAIVIPDSVTKIGGLAFESCTSLKSIAFGAGITELSLNVIYNCPALAEISFSSPDGWCDTDGNPLDLSDAAQNVNILNSLYAARKGTIKKN